MMVSQISKQNKYAFQICRSEPSTACSIFCQFKDRNAFFTPKIQLNDFRDYDVYMPDGYNCHQEPIRGKMTQFYCLGESTGRALALQ